ncbi:MAG: FoF1 ATP synthase subunit delta, partial [Thermodesulfovibrionales bacterium]
MKIQAALINRAARAFMNTVNIELIPDCLGELSTLNNLLEKNRDFKGFFLNPLFTPDERERVLNTLKEKMGLSDGTVKFLGFLLEEKAIAGLPEIIKKITILYLDKKRRAKATVVTPVSLDTKYDERLKLSLKNLTGRDIDIDYVVDPA